ncbi:Regulator of drug sensitivity 2 [Meyerozyma sp. JA9]|nr:Regulator of drug sensitivity 2 [Meyerozyma sp. JA9]
MEDYDSSASMKSEDAVSDTTTPLQPDNTRKRRKKKVEIACVYCRRSHMICDDSRPCQRCIKRGIGHLCYDEPSTTQQKKKASSLGRASPEINTSPSTYSTQNTPASQYSHQSNQQQPTQPANFVLQNTQNTPQQQQVGSGNGAQQPLNRSQNSVLSQTIPYNQEPFFYSEHAGSEFSSLNDFLSMIDDPDLVNGALMDNNGVVDFAGTSNTNGLMDIPENANLTNMLSFSPTTNNMFPSFAEDSKKPAPNPRNSSSQQNAPPGHQPVISDSARDKFFLTAADPTTEISPEERLKQVIKAKLEAGLLQPYNYAKGYARLQSYMDNYMNASSRQRILKPLSIFRPAFRAIARTLKDVDLVLVEESFERMLLDYDRVFTSMAIPACLWRRTGEIYRGNKEFASLVGVKADDLKDGKLAIYELMSEESAVNFWEKYGAIAFDKGQKAVLTSCNLRTRDGTKRKSCCFSFTIRRDRYNIPSCIVGNFIPIDP